MKKLSLLFGVFFLLAGVTPSFAQTIEDGKMISFEYKLYVDDELIESSDEAGPLEYEHGAEQIIPGLEEALTGKNVGDQLSVTIAAEDAYGEIQEDAFREIPKTDLPQDGPAPQVGMVLELISPEGEGFPVVIAEVKEDTVVLDFNHPLAGKELKFDVTIQSVE